MPKKEKSHFEELWTGLQEIREIHKEISLMQKENDRLMKENDKYLERLGKQLGYMGRSMGEIVELVVIPGVRKKMNAYGHCFTRIGPSRSPLRHRRRDIHRRRRQGFSAGKRNVCNKHYRRQRPAENYSPGKK